MFHAVKHAENKINVTEDYLRSTFINLLFIHHLLSDSKICCMCICADYSIVIDNNMLIL